MTWRTASDQRRGRGFRARPGRALWSLPLDGRSGPPGRPPVAGRGGRARGRDSGGAGLLAQAGEQDEAAAALARYALRVAQEAAAGLESSTGEVPAARRLDAEDATMRQVLAWALEQDAALAARVAVALAPWWSLRGRAVGQYLLLREAAGHAAPGSEEWGTPQFWLGNIALDF